MNAHLENCTPDDLSGEGNIPQYSQTEYIEIGYRICNHNRF